MIGRYIPLILLALAACASGPATTRSAVKASTDIGLGLGTLPSEGMPKTGCAVFLWRAGDNGRLLLVARSDPPAATVNLDGRIRSLARAGTDAVSTSYADGEDRITLDVVIEQRRGLEDGAVISSGSLRLDRSGGATIVVPVSGLIGCAK